MTYTLGSLCTGYGGLDLAVELALGPVRRLWHAEVDQAASTVLAARFPGVTNLGDLRSIDWSILAVEILLAGFPCQPVSAAGKRAGLTDERWLFDDIADGVSRMGARPRLLVFENVPGLLTANRGRAMGRVIHRLAALGYVGRYRVVSAADVGAPHLRRRVFIVAWLRDAEPIRPASGVSASAAGSAADLALLPTPRSRDWKGDAAPEWWAARAEAMRAAGRTEGLGAPLGAVLAMLPTPRASDSRRGVEPIRNGRTGRDTGPALGDAVALLPTPTTANAHGNQRNGRGELLLPGAVALLPTPRATDGGTKGGPNQRGSSGDLMLPSAVQPGRFGAYADAIARWEYVTGRPAPEPTEPNRAGNPRLAAPFAEWLMGLPAGWVTDLVARNDALRLIGNGVVPQQGAHALAALTHSA